MEPERISQQFNRDRQPRAQDRLPVLDVHASQTNLDSSQLPILVTGIAGVAGYNLFYHLRQKYGDQVIGIRGVNNWRLQHDGIYACDIEDRRTLKFLFEKYCFRSVLNCGGSCALKACELDPAMAHRVNVEGIKAILTSIDHLAESSPIELVGTVNS
ncbi:MAG: NAD-dependent epimerase/dehydratase family protein [Planctomycetota bacterium]